MIFVPKECKQCIFLQSSVFHDWLKDHSDPKSVSLKLDDNMVLAFFLLHELGHIHQGEASEAIGTNGISYNISDTHQKALERAADEYAASKIREAANKRGTSRATTAMQVEMALTNLSWNLASNRLLNHFGGTSLNSPNLFWDNGYTHPNIELRILTVNDLIDKTEDSHKLIEDFKVHILEQSTKLYLQ